MLYDHEGFSIYLPVYVCVYTHIYTQYIQTEVLIYIYMYTMDRWTNRWRYTLFVVYLLVNDLLFVLFCFFSGGSGEVGSYAL